MRAYILTEVRDDVLLRDLATLIARDRATTAALLAHMGEVDARKLYLPAGHPSMFAYCVDELGLSEDAAYKRITAARAARQFPALFAAVEEGRLHLTALRLLAPHLTAENIEELVTAATHRRKSEIEELLARRFPAPAGSASVPVRASLKPVASRQLPPGRVAAAATTGKLVFMPVESLVSSPVSAPAPEPERFALHVTIGKETRDKLVHAQALLGHSIPTGDVALVLDRALVALIRQLEKRKFAASERPRSQRPGKRAPVSTRARHVPAHVRRAVWERDQGRCSFVGGGGRRCPERRFLEFDHVEPVARGGRATIEGMRLRCRAHNQ